MRRMFVLFSFSFVLLTGPAYAFNNELFAKAGIERINGTPPAIEFTRKSPDGKMVSLKDFRGKVVFLNFWATWCPPCRSEMPDMENLYKKYKDRGFALVAVNVQESADTAKRFVQKNGYTFTVLLDSNGDVSAVYSVVYIPTTYIIDKDGRLVGKAAGAREWGSSPISNLMEELLK